MNAPMDELRALLARRAQLGAEFDAMVAERGALTDLDALAYLDANRADARLLSRLIADIVEARAGV